MITVAQGRYTPTTSAACGIVDSFADRWRRH
jgi:hypothetical protein